jgi:hypothetical protein
VLIDIEPKYRCYSMGQDEKSQIDKFKEAARDLGCDESEQAFEEKLKRIAKAKKRPDEGKEPVKD